jgi:hypothetical protein
MEPRFTASGSARAEWAAAREQRAEWAAARERRGGTLCRRRVEWRAVKRWLFTILSALSLLLFVAVLVLWVLSHTAFAKAGKLRLDVPARGGMHRHILGFRHGLIEYELWRTRRGASGWNTSMPLGVPGALLLYVMVILNRWHRQLRKREHAGLCPSCGYDLRATPDRCPECGTAVAGPGAVAPAGTDARIGHILRGGRFRRP